MVWCVCRPGALSSPMVPDVTGASQILEKYQVENGISRLFCFLSYVLIKMQKCGKFIMHGFTEAIQD